MITAIISYLAAFAIRLAFYVLIIYWQGWNVAFLVLGIDILMQISATKKV